MKRLKKTIKRYIKESIDSIFVDQISSLVFSGIIIWIFGNNLPFIDNQNLSIIDKFIVLGCTFFVVYTFSTLIHLRPNRYKFRMKSIYILVEYQGDYVDVYSTYRFSTNRFKANRMYSRRTWFSNEVFKYECETEGYKIEKIRQLSDTHEYYIRFPKNMYFGQTKTFKCHFSGSNKKRKFENFYWYEVICPTDELIIEVRVPRVYCTDKAELKSFLDHEDSVGSDKTEINFNGVYKWEIPDPKVGWSYKFEWNWSTKELALKKQTEN